MGSHLPVFIVSSSMEAKGIAAILIGPLLGAIFIWAGFVRIAQRRKEGSRAIG